MSQTDPNPTEVERAADFLQTLAMSVTGQYPMPVVEAIAQRADERTDDES